MSEQNKSALRKWIVVISIIIPIAVAALFGIKIDGVDLSFLPPVYATINGLTAVLLLIALAFIKRGKVQQHQKTIQTALFLSVLFLVCYVAYHMTSDTTIYDGKFKVLYYTLLISHIVLSVAVIPIVLFTYLHAWEGNYQRHKKWTRFAFPVWLYVAVSGVLVYIMISPFYNH